jgi:hypothetical protein
MPCRRVKLTFISHKGSLYLSQKCNSEIQWSSCEHTGSKVGTKKEYNARERKKPTKAGFGAGAMLLRGNS